MWQEVWSKNPVKTFLPGKNFLLIKNLFTFACFGNKVFTLTSKLSFYRIFKRHSNPTINTHMQSLYSLEIAGTQ